VSKGVTSYALPNSRATAPIDARAERSDQPSSNSSFIIHRSSLSWLSNWSAFHSSPFALSSARTLSPLVAFATAYTWNQTGTASYTTSTNWTPTRTTPATDDILVFNNGATTTLTNVPPGVTIGAISVGGGTNVTLEISPTGTLTLSGGISCLDIA